MSKNFMVLIMGKFAVLIGVSQIELLLAIFVIFFKFLKRYQAVFIGIKYPKTDMTFIFIRHTYGCQ